jgi:hypothetical protein
LFSVCEARLFRRNHIFTRGQVLKIKSTLLRYFGVNRPGYGANAGFEGKSYDKLLQGFMLAAQTCDPGGDLHFVRPLNILAS